MTDIIKTAQDLHKRDTEAWAEVYRKGKDDVRFLSDDEFAQWDQKDAARRKDTGRPALTIDQLGQFIHQVANDVRMNTPTINVIPSDDAASVETARIYQGKIKDIEYRSSADDAYDLGVTNAIKGSIGFIRVDHDYADDVSDKQELFIRRVTNPFSVMIDCNSTEVDGSDAMHGHVVERMTVDKFKSKYPGKDPVSFEDEKGKVLTKSDQEVTICEFYKIEEETRDVGYLQGGQPEDYQEGVEYSARRTLKKRKVMRYTLSGKDVLEETTFPGKYVPIVPVYGEEAWEDGKRNLFSLIRKSKDAQRMFNYWKSLETELLMKQPQAPVMAAAGSVENYTKDWEDPSKSMVLRYDVYGPDGKPLPPPQRLEAPTIPTGIINASREAVDDIKATMGIYNASLGAKSNETSGVAINQRKIEGDVATYHFGDNLVKSITHVGRILVCAIPEIYDTERLIRVIDEEDEPKTVGINGAMAPDQEATVDLSQGKYDVRVVTGASFTTQRQETVAALTQMFSANPELMSFYGDIFFKNSDFAGAQAMAKRAEKMLPPALQDENTDQEKIQLTQALEQANQQVQAMAEQLKSRQENEQLKAQVETTKAQSELERAKIDAAVKMEELKIKQQELVLKAQENQIKAMEIEARRKEAMRPADNEQSGSLN